MATYHSGTISSDETWTTAGNPHIVNGNLILADGVHLTIDPGVNVEFSGSYYFYLGGKCTIDGADGNPIEFYSTVAYPKNNSYSYVYFGYGAGAAELDADSTLSWCIFKHSNGVYFGYWAGMDSDPATHHLVVENCGNLVFLQHGPASANIENIFIRNCTNGIPVYTDGDDVTFDNIHIIGGGTPTNAFRPLLSSGSGSTTTFKNFLIEDCSYWFRGNAGSGTIVVQDGFVKGHGRGDFYKTDCTVERVSFYEVTGAFPVYGRHANLNMDSEYNDFMNGEYECLYGLAKTTFTSDNDYMEGMNDYARGTVDDTEDTGSASQMYRYLSSNRTNAKAAPNRPLDHPMPYTVSGVTANEATIAVTTNVKCSSMIEYYDTASPNNRMRTNIKYNDWSETNYIEDSDGNQPTTSHSHVLHNLKSGTTYEYFIVMIAPWGEVKDGVIGASFTTDAAAGGGWYAGE